MGDSVNNLLPEFHYQPATGLFEVKVTRHLGSGNINAGTSAGDEDDWAAIVTSAASTDSDTTFAAVVAGVWPTWTQDHLVTPGLVAGFRTAVKKIVRA